MDGGYDWLTELNLFYIRVHRSSGGKHQCIPDIFIVVPVYDTHQQRSADGLSFREFRFPCFHPSYFSSKSTFFSLHHLIFLKAYATYAFSYPLTTYPSVIFVFPPPYHGRSLSSFLHYGFQSPVATQSPTLYLSTLHAYLPYMYTFFCNVL